MAPKPPGPQPGSRAQSRAKSRAKSREPSQSRPPQPQPQPQDKPHRGRSRSRRSPSVTSTLSDSGPEENFLPETRRKRRGKKQRQHASTLPVLDEVETTGKEVVGAASNAVTAVGDTTSAVAGTVGDNKPLKLRLDLNLDADIRLTAKIHGDVTLSLL